MTTESATAMEQPAPVTAKERIESLDVVRGFAMLGILGPNIVAFAWPSAAMTSPAAMGDTPWNQAGHAITSIFFLGKFMALFAMLFGAGVIVYSRKFEHAPRCRGCQSDLSGNDPSLPCPHCGEHDPRRGRLRDGAGLWYRRIGFLALFGILHAVLLWFGDILTWYAVTALLAVWWVRRLTPGVQIGVGVALHLISTLLLLGLSALGIWAVAQGHISRDELMGNQAVEFQGYTGTYLDALLTRLPTLAMFWLILAPLFTPGVTGLMMIGMGLLRTGVLSGQRSTRFYTLLAAIGLLGGLGVTIVGFYGIERLWPGFGGFIWQSCSQFVGIPISLGYMALLILLLRTGRFGVLMHPLAAVGRMALSNYLLQTLLCTTFFYGYGFGYFGRIGYPDLFLVMGAVWGVNILFSLIWLRFFRFGPAEWLWRSLTYLRPQPMLR
ncbi:MAG: DUF418 domain-containing protein [Leptolyngbya sp. PLA3]|nr:MAG: DUF418 domain-containing protein [Cyanobacteria bacterium CYA]MCE7968640.1 DUF418 domain-containing protein [Leptolyngbya sp. PL-A3]